MKELINEFLSSRPTVIGAYGYGSGVFKQLGYNTIFWSVAYKDWDTNNQSGMDKAVNSVIKNLHNGAIILLHSVSKDNVKALPVIIDKIKEEGYEIKTLYNLFNS